MSDTLDAIRPPPATSPAGGGGLIARGDTALVASQLPAAFNDAIAAAAAAAQIVIVPPGPPPSLPRGAEVLIAAPFRKAGGTLTAAPPPGWPFDLKWVQLVSVGTDFYPDWLFQGPVVTCARGSSATALAEFALAAIFAHAKRAPQVWIDSPERWAPVQLDLVEGATLGIVGFGAVGQALAPKAMALGMTVLANRRSDTPLEVAGVERADLADLFARSDHVVLAAPATRETVGLVDAAFLAHAKPGLHLVNVARGALVDDAALLEALDSGRLSGVTLDVTHPEPLTAGHPFYTHPKVRLSPHTSVFTPDTRLKLAAQFAANLDRFRRGEPLTDVVDSTRGY